MKVRLTNLAELDVRAAVDWYDLKSEGLGTRFVADLEIAIGHLEQFPFAWQPLGAEVRRYRLDHFPYGVYYVIHGDECLVFAVDHLRRAPKHWRQRLKAMGADRNSP